MAKNVLGPAIDAQTRCVHYHGPTDIVAIKFFCCGDYYPCFECHAECSGHEALHWPRSQFVTKAVLCGACGAELSIAEYMDCDSRCPQCSAGFNPGCREHWRLYFEMESGEQGATGTDERKRGEIGRSEDVK